MSLDTSLPGGNTYHSGTSNNDQTNISIKHLMHIHTIDPLDDDTAIDKIIESDTNDYQNNYIPPASSPILGLPDPTASDEKPAANQSPQGEYLTSVQEALQNLPSSLLSSLSSKGNSLDGLNKLIYAFNHPNANVGSQLRSIINQVQTQATAKTQSLLNLGSDWAPKPPDTNAADQQLNQDYNSAFETLVKSSDLPEDKADLIIFLHYHPESSADPTLTADLENFEQTAFSQVAEQEGLPSDAEKPPVDSSEYDAKVSRFYDDAFTEHLTEDPQTSSLPENEIAELETLHQFPDADVPDKDKLSSLLNNLESEALQDTKSEFNLPSTFKPSPSFTDFAGLVLGQFKNEFNQNVQNFSPPLTQAQQQLLLNTNGISSKNLPPALQAAFQSIQNKTAGDVADMMGLPKDWLSSTTNEETDDTGKTLADGSEETSEAEENQETGNVGINAFAKVLGKLLNTQKKGETQDIDGLEGVSNTAQYSTTLSALGLAQDATKAINTRVAQFPSASGGFQLMGDGWMSAGDFTALISSCLDKLRQCVYQMQASSSSLAQKTSAMSIAITQDKSAIQKEELAKNNALADSQKPQKSWSASITSGNKGDGWAIVASMMVLACLFPFLLPWVAALVVSLTVTLYTNPQGFVQGVQASLWCVDMVTGGALSSICTAANLEPLSQNPLAVWHAVSSSTAQWIDLGVSIGFMVAQIAVEAVLGQAELIIPEITSFAEKAALTVKTVAQATVDSIKTAFTETLPNIISRIAEEGPKAVIAAALKSAVQSIKLTIAAMGPKLAEFGNFLSTKGTQLVETIEEMAEAGKQTAKELAEQLSEFLADIPTKISEGITSLTEAVSFDNFSEATKAALAKALQAFKDTGIEMLKSMNKILENLSLLLSEPEQHIQEIVSLGGILKDVTTSVLDGVTQINQGILKDNQAALIKAIGILDAKLEELDTTAKVINAATQQILNQLDQLTEWIGDINKQESDFYKKMPIRFIAA